jgi:drug/metabolite transporter (DMT)-like permease
LYGIAANYTSEKLSQVSPLTIATMSQLAAAALLLPISLFFLPQGEISLTAWLAVVALGVLCTSLAYLMYFRLIAHVGSSNAVTVAFLVPVFGMFWGAVFLDEQITTTMVVGAAVILVGTALVTGVLKIKGLSVAR